MSGVSQRHEGFSPEQAFVAPRTPVENRLASIWAKVLGVELVGIHDNIFELGAGSLLATQVVTCIMVDFQVKLPLLLLLESPTVAGIAAFIEEQQTKVIEDGQLDQLLAELEALPDGEAERLLSEAGE